jgi:hypothetical protein
MGGKFLKVLVCSLYPIGDSWPFFRFVGWVQQRVREASLKEKTQHWYFDDGRSIGKDKYIDQVNGGII